MEQACMSAEIGELAKALAAAQSKIEPASKNAKNPMLHNKYADLASCYEACRKVLPEHGLAVSQIILPAEQGSVCVRTMLMHSSGQWLASDCVLPAQGNKGVNAAQAAGSAVTYARRYGLSAIIGLVADDDDDGCKAGQTVQQQRDTAKQNNASPMSSEQSKALMAYLTKMHGDDRHAYLAELGSFLGRTISSSRELTKDEVSDFLSAVSANAAPVSEGELAYAQ